VSDEKGLKRVALFRIVAKTLYEAVPVLRPIHVVTLRKIVPRPGYVHHKLGVIEERTQRTLHGFLERSALHVNQQSSSLHGHRAVSLWCEAEKRRQRLVAIRGVLMFVKQLVPKLISNLITTLTYVYADSFTHAVAVSALA
jgi:hypothetical protein